MGFGFALATSVLFAASNVYMRKAGRTVDGRSAMTTILAVNALILGPIAAVVVVTGSSPVPGAEALLAFAAVGIVGGWLGRWGLYVAIGALGAGRASAVKNASPLFAVLIGLVVLHERPRPIPLMGIAFILLGVWLLSREPTTGHASRPTREGPIGPAQRRSAITNTLVALTPARLGAGLSLAIGVAFLFALADVIRSIGMEEYPNALVGAAVASASAWLSALGLNHVVRRRAGTGPAWPRPTAAVIAVAIITGIAQVTNFLAVRFMLVAYVSAIIALTPLFTAALDGVVSRGTERYDRRFYASALLLVVGASLIGVYS